MPVLVKCPAYLVLWWVYSSVVALGSHTETSFKPEFAEPIPNITVSAGRDVSIPCVVDHLGKYRVAWIHTDRSTLLTLANRVITRNSRYQVSHNSHRTWWLRIKNVQMRDKGQYMCQINTSPMKNQVGYIKVVVPPKIDETLTSKDTEVREGEHASLKCIASGSPEPEITWRREDEQAISLGNKKVLSTNGSYLNINKVSRLHMGAYLCIAVNGIPPAVSKRIFLGVNFSPMIWIPNQLIGAPLGTDVVLDCNLEAHPIAVTYWMKEGGVIIISNRKYETVDISEENYKGQLHLTIRDLEPQDYGSYTCVAKNSLGETEGTIRLYEIPGLGPFTNGNSRAEYSAKSEKLRNGYAENSLIGNNGGKEGQGSSDMSGSLHTDPEESKTGTESSTTRLEDIQFLQVTLLMVVSFLTRLALG
ncbi:neurotrimin-like isoform X2 [Tachypleus tridentatus]|uniref:neurotrimin-like isoform X2 n=1 Tax=Tachypleus tridentatus TaxID=6853 RepID=UPI003FCF575D